MRECHVMAFKTASCFSVAVMALFTPPALASGALRDLPDSSVPGVLFAVTIALDPPPGTSVAAAEDAPPSGWTVSNISNGGTLDVQSGKVKWGLFFAPSIPATLTYNVTPVGQSSICFGGTVSFDGAGAAITGDACINSIPTVSTWSAVALSLMLLIGGSVIKRTR